MEVADKIHVNSFLIGVLVALSLISVYLSYQSNRQQSENGERISAIGSEVSRISKFVDENDFVK